MTVPRPLSDFPAEEEPVVIIQGQTFAMGWELVYDENDDLPAGKSVGDPIDLTDYTGRMQVRSSLSAAGTLLDLTTANTGVVITAATGKVEIAITATATAALDEIGLSVWPGTDEFPNEDGWLFLGVADLELVDGSSVVTRIIEMDSVLLDPEVTRT